MFTEVLLYHAEEQLTQDSLMIRYVNIRKCQLRKIIIFIKYLYNKQMMDYLFRSVYLIIILFLMRIKTENENKKKHYFRELFLTR